MIYSVRGKLIYSQNETVVVECAGVGYECRTSFSTIQAVAGKEEVMLYTHLSVREDAVELFGFATKEELKSFRMLIGVSGVGPKAAISILSSCTPSQFALAVATGDSASFTKIKGIGAKTAQRIVLELKDKVVKGGGSENIALFSPAENSAAVEEATTALVMLGFTKANVNKAVAAVLKEHPNATLEEIIKLGLKRL